MSEQVGIDRGEVVRIRPIIVDLRPRVISGLPAQLMVVVMVSKLR